MTRAIRWVSMVIVFAAVLSTPEVTLAQGFPSQSGGQTTGGRTHHFQEFGFSSAWGSEWTVVDQAGGPGTGFEAIALDNGVSHVTIMGIATTDSPQRIATLIADNHLLELELMEVHRDEPDQAAGWYIPDDALSWLGAYIDARTLDNDAALTVVWVFDVQQLRVEADAFNALLNGLRY